MSRMFHKVKKTWNPVIGCRHNCSYCWARNLAETRLRKTEKYRDGFKPKIWWRDIDHAKFPENAIVFVSDMGDLFGEWVPRKWINAIIEVVESNPKTTFLFLTKNPERYHEFSFPENAILGATIETDRDEIATMVSDAPPPSQRIEAMKKLNHEPKMVSIEPILSFSPNFHKKIMEIEPAFVYIGYDNYNNKLPEPPLEETQKLVEALKQAGIEVHEKTIRKAWYQ